MAAGQGIRIGLQLGEFVSFVSIAHGFGYGGRDIQGDPADLGREHKFRAVDADHHFPLGKLIADGLLRFLVCHAAHIDACNADMLQDRVALAAGTAELGNGKAQHAQEKRKNQREQSHQYAGPVPCEEGFLLRNRVVILRRGLIGGSALFLRFFCRCSRFWRQNGSGLIEGADVLQLLIPVGDCRGSLRPLPGIFIGMFHGDLLPLVQWQYWVYRSMKTRLCFRLSTPFASFSFSVGSLALARNTTLVL